MLIVVTSLKYYFSSVLKRGVGSNFDTYNYVFVSIEVVQIKIEVPPETLQNGKTITIQKSSTTGSMTTGSNQKQQPSGNFVDLYANQQLSGSTGRNNVHIEIPEQLIEKGETILIQKDNVSVTKTSDYCKQQAKHVVSNQFNKWDHLQSKSAL